MKITKRVLCAVLTCMLIITAAVPAQAKVNNVRCSVQGG